MSGFNGRRADNSAMSLRACLKMPAVVGRGSWRALQNQRPAAAVEARLESRPTTAGIFKHALSDPNLVSQPQRYERLEAANP